MSGPDCEVCTNHIAYCLCDTISSPAHYTHGSIETIEVIEDWELGYHLGNAIKYISRAGRKDPDKTVEDLRKAVWYLEREITNEEKDNG